MFFFNRSTLQCDDILTNQLAANTFVIGSQDANLSLRCKKIVGRHLAYAGGQLCFSGLQRQLYFVYKSTRIILSLAGHPLRVGIAFWVIFEGLNQKLINTNIICVSKFRVIIDATLIDACAKTVMCAYGLQLLSCIRKKKKQNTNDVANSSNIIAHQRIICQMSPR